MFPVIEREFVAAVSCFAIVFCHADVPVRESGGQCYKGFTLVFYKSSYCLPC